MGITRPLKNLLSTEQEAEAEAATSGTDAGLFRCPGCDTTYVSTAMETCSNCGSDVESVPTARDLGMR